MIAQNKIGDAPCFSKELVDSSKVGLSNFIKFLLQLCSITKLWLSQSSQEIQALKKDS